MIDQERIKRVLDMLYGTSTTDEELETLDKEAVARIAEDVRVMLKELEFCIWGKK